MQYLFVLLLTFQNQVQKFPAIYHSKGGVIEFNIDIKGSCKFKKKNNNIVIIFDTISQKPLQNAKVVIQNSNKSKQIIQSNNKGEIILKNQGQFFLNFTGNKYYFPCGFNINITNISQKHSSFNLKFFILWITIGFLILIFFFNIIKVKFNIIKVFRKKKKRFFSSIEFYNTNSIVEKRKNLFFGSNYTLVITDWYSDKPVKSELIIKYNADFIEKLSTDDNGIINLSFKGKHINLITISSVNYKEISIVPTIKNGTIKVKIMKKQDWALMLFFEICKKVMPEKAKNLTPDEAINLSIPPENIIKKLEEIVYGNLHIDEDKLNQLKKGLNID